MNHFSDSSWWALAIICFALALVVLAGMTGYFAHDLLPRPSKASRKAKALAAFEPPIMTNWRPTGRINAMGNIQSMTGNDDLPAPFHLLVEEKRLVEDITGAPLTEVRWRYACKNEVRDIVRRHHHNSGAEIKQLTAGPQAHRPHQRDREETVVDWPNPSPGAGGAVGGPGRDVTSQTRSS